MSDHVVGDDGPTVDDELEFDVHGCVCTHAPEQHSRHGCGERGCPCHAGWYAVDPVLGPSRHLGRV